MLTTGNGRWRRLWLLAALLASVAPGCDRSPPPAPPMSAEDDPDRVPPPPSKPDYAFAPGLREEYPEVTAFLRAFLENCLAGDYAGYRKMVSRLIEPETRERFQLVAHSILELEVISIAPVKLPELAGEAYRVVSAIEFDPESRVRLRRNMNEVAILVIREEGELRMLPAPPALQPAPPPTATASAPAPVSVPDYPWDQSGDR